MSKLWSGWQTDWEATEGTGGRQCPSDLCGKGIWERLGTGICITKSPFCIPGTNTTLFINCTRIENKIRESGMHMYTLLYLKWIPTKSLLYSTGNSAQSYVAAWMGGDFRGRMDTCICMAESLCGSSETMTTLLIGHTPIQNKKKKK